MWIHVQKDVTESANRHGKSKIFRVFHVDVEASRSRRRRHACITINRTNERLFVKKKKEKPSEMHTPCEK